MAQAKAISKPSDGDGIVWGGGGQVPSSSDGRGGAGQNLGGLGLFGKVRQDRTEASSGGDEKDQQNRGNGDKKFGGRAPQYGVTMSGYDGRRPGHSEPMTRQEREELSEEDTAVIHVQKGAPAPYEMSQPLPHTTEALSKELMGYEQYMEEYRRQQGEDARRRPRAEKKTTGGNSHGRMITSTRRDGDHQDPPQAVARQSSMGTRPKVFDFHNRPTLHRVEPEEIEGLDVGQFKKKEIDRLIVQEAHFQYAMIDARDRLDETHDQRDRDRLVKECNTIKSELTKTRKKLHFLRDGHCDDVSPSQEVKVIQATPAFRRTSSTISATGSGTTPSRIYVPSRSGSPTERSVPIDNEAVRRRGRERDSEASKSIWTFEGRPADSFDHWTVAWKEYCSKRPMTEREAALTMMRFLGRRPQHKLSSLSKREWTNPNLLLEELTKAYNNATEGERARHAFRKTIQNPNEPIKDFMDKLKMLRKKGWPDEVGTWKKNLEAKKAIARKFFAGLVDQEHFRHLESVIRISVSADHDDYLDRVLIEVEREEMMLLDKSSRVATPAPQRITTEGRSREHKRESRPKRTRELDHVREEVDEYIMLVQKQNLCYGCHEPGHFRRECPNGGKLKNASAPPGTGAQGEHPPNNPQLTTKGQTAGEMFIAEKIKELCDQVSRIAHDVDYLKKGVSHNTERLAKVEEGGSISSRSDLELDDGQSTAHPESNC